MTYTKLIVSEISQSFVMRMQTRLPPDLTQKRKRVRRILQFKNGGYGHGKSQLITNLSSFAYIC